MDHGTNGLVDCRSFDPNMGLILAMELIGDVCSFDDIRSSLPSFCDALLEQSSGHYLLQVASSASLASDRFILR